MNERHRLGKAQNKLGMVLILLAFLCYITLFLLFGFLMKDWISGIPFLIIGIVFPAFAWYIFKQT